MTDAELRDYVRRARIMAGSQGSLHSWWEVIADAEAILAGKPAIVSRDVIERMLREWLG